MVKASATKNGPSAAMVVKRAIVVRRYALFCRISSMRIYEISKTPNKNTNGAIIKVNDCLSMNMT
jgi:oligoribonuclease NrnB/cAMP/cGMP phosphodiesterase (DHH superfamily)